MVKNVRVKKCYSVWFWSRTGINSYLWWAEGVETVLWLLAEGEEQSWEHPHSQSSPCEAPWTPLEGRSPWPDPSVTQFWKAQEIQHGETCSTMVLLLWDQQQRSSKAEAPEPWLFMGGDASTVHDRFQEEWKPWRCPADVWRSHSCYLLTGSLGSCWAQSKVSPGTRQMMNLGCKILCAPLPFWPVILHHMSSGLQIPKKQQFATLDL